MNAPELAMHQKGDIRADLRGGMHRLGIALSNLQPPTLSSCLPWNLQHVAMSW